MELPSDFTSYTRQLFGDELYDKFAKALNEEPPVSIRLNQFKTQSSILKPQTSKLNSQTSILKPQTSNLNSQTSNLKAQTSKLNPQTSNLKAQSVPWCPLGYYLGGRPAFTFDPLLHAGLYYVQEASSMFVCEVVRQLVSEPVLALDLCAAPGGKSTALRSSLPDGSLLFANEPIKPRASILKENMQKFGHTDVIVTNNFPKDYRKTKLAFDLILADVPCSGEGMFRKDPNAIQEWSQQNVEKCRALQRSIIEDIWPCLRQGGLLVYSTCTFNAHEDEENVGWIADALGADFINIETRKEWGITGSLVGGQPACRFIPGMTRGEGLFMAVLRKHGDAPTRHDKPRKAATPRNTKATERLKEWLTGDFTLTEENGFIRAIPSAWADIYNNVRNKLHIIHAGVGLGTVKGRDIIPDASLPLSLALNRNAFSMANVDYASAISFLRKEAVTLDASVPRGFAIVTYKGRPLGFVKNLGNRANNLYPQEWRIKTTHAPDGDVDILNSILLHD